LPLRLNRPRRILERPTAGALRRRDRQLNPPRGRVTRCRRCLHALEQPAAGEGGEADTEGSRMNNPTKLLLIGTPAVVCSAVGMGYAEKISWPEAPTPQTSFLAATRPVGPVLEPSVNVPGPAPVIMSISGIRP